jgi:hypothetical protein
MFSPIQVGAGFHNPPQNLLWLVVWNMAFMTFHMLGMEKSPQLTFTPSFFREVGQPPTSTLLMKKWMEM